VVNVTSTLFAVMYVIVTFGVLRHRRAAGVPAGGYRVPGGNALIWLAALFSLYLTGLSLLQQYKDAGSRWPPEWWLMLGCAAAGWAAWSVTGAARSRLSEAERRRIVLEQH